MKSIQVKRKKPKGFENVTELIQIRPPKSRDLYDLDFINDSMRSCAALLSRCTALTLEEIEDLDAAEFLKLQNKLNEYL